jgi:dipeptidyl aminopeptidase/acylaminoacyl peptidase
METQYDSLMQIEPTVAAGSMADDSPTQAELRAELKHSGLKICYQSRRDGNSELYIMDADGSNQVNITNTPDVDEVYPHVSADGKRVCFTTVSAQENSVRFDVYWMNIDGSGRTLVASDATDPCWNASGDKIAFVKRISREKTIDYQNTGLFVYDIHTGETEEITGGKLYHAYVPCWSPSGDWVIATVHEHAEFGHAIIAIDLENRGKIYSLDKCGVNGCRPDFSWDGQMFCWNSDDYHIRVVPFDPPFEKNIPTLTVAKAPEGGSVYFGDWSPDGKYIAYAMNPNVKFEDAKTRALWDIFVTCSSGGHYVQITFDHANNKQPEFFLSV